MELNKINKLLSVGLTEGQAKVVEVYINELLKNKDKIIDTSKTRMITVKGYTDYTFNNIDCMISYDGEELGFFKNSNDVRPSSATYIKKDEADHLYKIFTSN